MKITLNENDLKGRYLDSTDCPIARCLKRMGYEYVSVGGWTVTIKGKKYQLPNNGNDAIASIFQAKGEGLKSVEVVIEGLPKLRHTLRERLAKLIQRLWEK